MNIEKYTEELITLRHYFHQHPELALQEVETSAYIRKYLEKLGYEIVPIEPTGLIAELSSLRNREKLVVLRAEMDALPIQEQTNLPYASVNQGCMHACGHDMILAAALILAKIVAEEQRMQENFPVRLRFLFEPAEEIGEGAKRMLQAGALENPKADAFLMFHYAADMTFGMAVHQGQASSMINSMQIHVHGKSSHWCEADAAVVQRGYEYLKGFAPETLLTAVLFSMMGYFNGNGKTVWVMLQGLIQTLLVRLPFAYYMSIQPDASLTNIGLAAPISTAVGIVLNVAFFLYLEHAAKRS